VYPDDRSKIFIRRIEGLPDEVITLPNGKKEHVPHEMIYVLGEINEHRIDSDVGSCSRLCLPFCKD
jgi:uncharacterized protein YlzI (FlbEa/FlbD family)